MGKKFAASYSSGKDSTLAVYRAIEEGMEPVSLILTQNNDPSISWFHGLSEEMTGELSKALDIPIERVVTSGEAYAADFEKALIKCREKGAEVCVFGDIDIEGHLEWCTERCRNAGLTAYFPLWHRNREDVVREFIDSGFSTYLTVINSDVMDEKYIGQKLTYELLEEMKEDGIDVCGENGEYHSFVTDGPLFSRPVVVQFSKAKKESHYLVMDVEPVKHK